MFGQRGRMVGGLLDRCCNICCLLCWESDKLLMNTFLVQSAQAGRALITGIRNRLIIKFVQHSCCNCSHFALQTDCPAFCFACFDKGRSPLGHPEESSGDELRQTQQIVALLLRERNHAKGKNRDLPEKTAKNQIRKSFYKRHVNKLVFKVYIQIKNN